jgi:hypothetical protein
MNICYHMVKIDGHDTLCIGGRVIPDDENAGFLWLTNMQGEKLLHIYYTDYRVVTRGEAEDHLRELHARQEAEGSGPIKAVNVKTGDILSVAPAAPAPCPKPWNN